jgi:hypothetical protein
MYPHKVDPLKTSKTLSKLLKSKFDPATAGRRKPFDQQRRDQESGGARRDRTDDLLRAKQALSQLSYGPSENWWVWEDLNFRPHPYQGCALTN